MAGLALLAAGLFWLTSCAEERITVGINDWPPCQVWQVARQLKVDRSQGIQLKLVRFPSWRSNMEGFYRGNLDISHASCFNVVYYSERGEGGAIGIVADVTLGADGMVLAPAVPDVVIRSIVSAELPKAPQEGRADAVVTYEPFLAEASRFGRPVESTLSYPEAVKDVLVFFSRLASDRSLVRKVRRVWYDTLDWIFATPANLQAACELMAAEQGADLQGVCEFLLQFRFYSQEDNKRLLAQGGEVERVLADIQAFLLAERLLESRVPVRRLFLQ